MAKILLVDDDTRERALTAAFLKADHNVIDTASSLEEAKDFLATSTYEIVLVDRRLPDGDGIVLCDRYRHCRGAGIIILSARASIEDLEEALDAGADDYLSKPFALVELAARTRALLRRPRAPADHPLMIGEFALYPASLTIRRGNQQWCLSRKEFAILEFLARHPDQSFKGDVLSMRVWRSNEDLRIDCLRTAIKRIRKEVGDYRIIEHSRTAGYRAGFTQVTASSQAIR